MYLRKRPRCMLSVLNGRRLPCLDVALSVVSVNGSRGERRWWLGVEAPEAASRLPIFVLAETKLKDLETLVTFKCFVSRAGTSDLKEENNACG